MVCTSPSSKFHEIPDSLWERIDLMLPIYEASPRGGRPRLPLRKVVTGILYVLATGCQWKAMPPEFGPHRFFSPTGTNVAIRRDCLLSIGGFDQEYAYFLDETDVNLRLVEAGWRLVSIADAEVHHKFSESHLRSADRVGVQFVADVHGFARVAAQCETNRAEHHGIRFGYTEFTGDRDVIDALNGRHVIPSAGADQAVKP